MAPSLEVVVIVGSIVSPPGLVDSVAGEVSTAVSAVSPVFVDVWSPAVADVSSPRSRSTWQAAPITPRLAVKATAAHVEPSE
ncbi:hypothetical protein [Nannocystis exedens]|uniref:hypothetical protein n=1 Tax=Nannocystis exedens TaxID=54 RepID=UPI000BB9FDE1|nr:hypothetical protein [Nannocystis exedens]PCC75850.1 hypothetical protein NAEX_08963 [Nannocystis exedens]